MPIAAVVSVVMKLKTSFAATYLAVGFNSLVEDANVAPTGDAAVAFTATHIDAPG